MTPTPAGARLARLRLPLLLALIALCFSAPRIVPVDGVNGFTAEHGLRIGLDPDSGAPIGMPAAASHLKDLERSLDRSSGGLIVETQPDGTVGVDLQGRFHNASVARIDADGTLQHTCTSSVHDARCFLDASRPAPKWEVQ